MRRTDERPRNQRENPRVALYHAREGCGIFPLDYDIHVEIPSQFNMPGKVFKAKMSLEGLKQSGHLFQTEAYAQLRSQGAVQSTVDPNIWTG